MVMKYPWDIVFELAYEMTKWLICEGSQMGSHGVINISLILLLERSIKVLIE